MNTPSTDLPRLGTDVSKLTFDVCLRLPDNTASSATFANN